MNKKTYIIPATDVLASSLTQMIATSLPIDELLEGNDVLVGKDDISNILPHDMLDILP